MRPEDHSRRREYPSDVADDVWERVSPLVPPQSPLGRKRMTEPRRVLDALSYRWRTGCPWRMLPHDFPHWTTVYFYCRRWERAGVLGAIRDALLRRRRA